MAKSKIIFKKNKTKEAVENYIPDEEKKKLPTYDPARLKDVKKEKESTIPKTPRHKSRKTGHQVPHINKQGTETVPRTYLIEVGCLKKLEKIKLLHLDNEYVQYSEIINDAIDCYFEILCRKNS